MILSLVGNVLVMIHLGGKGGAYVRGPNHSLGLLAAAWLALSCQSCPFCLSFYHGDATPRLHCILHLRPSDSAQLFLGSLAAAFFFLSYPSPAIASLSESRCVSPKRTVGGHHMPIEHRTACVRNDPTFLRSLPPTPYAVFHTFRSSVRSLSCNRSSPKSNPPPC